MGSSPYLWLCACKTAPLGPVLVSLGPRPHLWICAIEAAYLPLELLVSICPRPHLCIFANKTACHTCPYGSQTSPVVL